MPQTLHDSPIESPACENTAQALLAMRWSLSRSDQGEGELEIRVTDGPSGGGCDGSCWCVAMMNGRVLREGPATKITDATNRQIHIDAPGLVAASVCLSEGQAQGATLLYARTAMLREVGVQGGQADAPRLVRWAG